MDELLDFSVEHHEIITKDIEFNSFHFPFGENSQVYIHQPVVKLSKADLENQNIKNKEKQFAHYSMYQQYLDKKYELRIFYLKGKFYTMAISRRRMKKQKLISEIMIPKGLTAVFLTSYQQKQKRK